jgi:hypothetical protein
MIVRRPRVPQRRDETLASLGRVTQRDVMARGLRFNPRGMSTPRPRRTQRPCVSRLLRTIRGIVRFGRSSALAMVGRTVPALLASYATGRAGEASTVTPAGSLGNRRAQATGWLWVVVV